MSGQNAVAGKAAAGSSRGFRLDPFALPVRSAPAAGVPAFVLDRERAVLRQRVAGVFATLAVPIRAYAGVAVRIEPVDAIGTIRVVVELMHADTRLSLPLVIADEPDEAAADWIAWGRALNLPLLVVEQDGTIRTPVARMGGVAVSGQAPRRNRAAFRGRRSRFVRRRKAGRSAGLAVLSGAEIIARD